MNSKSDADSRSKSTYWVVGHSPVAAVDSPPEEWYFDKQDAISDMQAYAPSTKIYELECELKVVSSSMSRTEFADAVEGVSDADFKEAFIDFLDSDMEFEKWWKDYGRKNWGVDTDHAMEALKEMLK